MDEHLSAYGRLTPGALQSVHRAGLLTMIALAVCICGFVMQSFLGHLGVASAEVGPDRPRAAAPPSGPAVPSPGSGTTGYMLVSSDPTFGPDQQTAFLETIRLSGTGGWSSRLDILGNGVKACHMLASGQQPDGVTAALVAGGEPPAQAAAVVSAAPDTLCPA